VIRLLWKEYREQRLWALWLVAMALGPFVFGKDYAFCRDISMITGWLALGVMLALAAAVFLGLNTYSSEIARGAGQFLYSRRTSWKAVLAAKLTLGIAVIIASAIIAALGYRLLCPAPLLRFATLDRLASGAGHIVVYTGCAYLFGVASSVALPGISGGVLVAVTSVMVIGLSDVALTELGLPRGTSSQLWVVALGIAVIITIRSGLLLPTKARVGRYALTAVTAAALLTALPLMVGRHNLPAWVSGQSMTDHYRISVSPDGAYVVANRMVPIGSSREMRTYMVRMADRSGVRLDAGQPRAILWAAWRWIGTKTAASSDGRLVLVARIKTAANIPMRKAVSVKTITLAGGAPADYALPLPSPNGKLALVASNVADSSARDLRFVDIENMRPLKLTVHNAQNYWWQSDTEVGYVDSGEKRHIVRVVEEAR